MLRLGDDFGTGAEPWTLSISVVLPAVILSDVSLTMPSTGMSSVPAPAARIAKQKTAPAQVSAATAFTRNVPRTSGAKRNVTTPL